MTHPRTQIRKAAARIVRDRTLAGSRVFLSRSEVTQDTELPCIVVYTRGETMRVENESPREERRTLRLAFEVIGAEDASGGTPDDQVDGILCDVEDLVLPCLHPDGLGVDFDIDAAGTGMESLEEGEDDTGRQVVGQLRLTVRVVYFYEVDETKSLPGPPQPFTGADVDYELEAGGNPEAQDEINVPTT